MPWLATSIVCCPLFLPPSQLPLEHSKRLVCWLITILACWIQLWTPSTQSSRPSTKPNRWRTSTTFVTPFALLWLTPKVKNSFLVVASPRRQQGAFASRQPWGDFDPTALQRWKNTPLKDWENWLTSLEALKPSVVAITGSLFRMVVHYSGRRQDERTHPQIHHGYFAVDAIPFGRHDAVSCCRMSGRTLPPFIRRRIGSPRQRVPHPRQSVPGLDLASLQKHRLFCHPEGRSRANVHGGMTRQVASRAVELSDDRPDPDRTARPYHSGNSIRTIGFLFKQLESSSHSGGPVSFLTPLTQPFAKTLNHASNEVKQLVAQTSHYLGRHIDTALPSDFLKVLLPQLVNGTKEKNTAVRSACEAALFTILRLRHNDETQLTASTSSTGARAVRSPKSYPKSCERWLVSPKRRKKSWTRLDPCV